MRPAEALRELRELRREVDELSRAAGRGSIQYLAGAQLDVVHYFHDGTWVEENDPATAKYGTSNDTYHGAPGIRQSDGSAEREVYLRLSRPVRLPAERDVTFVFFFGEVKGERDCSDQNQLDLTLGLVTAAFSQATLEALSWNSKLASDSGRIIGMLLEDNDAAAGSDWWRNTPDSPAGRCSALAVRFAPASATVITGIRIWIPEAASPDHAVGEGTIKCTRAGKPQRSFLVIE